MLRTVYEQQQYWCQHSFQVSRVAAKQWARHRRVRRILQWEEHAMLLWWQTQVDCLNQLTGFAFFVSWRNVCYMLTRFPYSTTWASITEVPLFLSTALKQPLAAETHEGQSTFHKSVYLCWYVNTETQTTQCLSPATMFLLLHLWNTDTFLIFEY